MRKLLVVALILMSIGVANSTADAEPTIGSLRKESRLFWKGGRVGGTAEELATLPSRASAGCMKPGTCFTYAIKLAETGERLRVAIDVPERRDMFEIAVIDPDGNSAASTRNLNAFNAEVFVPKPKPGVWTIAVSPVTADYSTFGLRAKLEKTIYRAPWAPMWKPNLIVPRLWEFGFVAPITGLAGISMDDANPPLQVMGIHPFSCTEDEAFEGATRCLRFSFQLSNAGEGVFDVRFNTQGDPQAGKMVQCLARPGKSPLAVNAGDFTFHEVHGHYHYEDVVKHELFKVVSGKLVLAGKGQKVGYHPADQSFARWTKFEQDASGTSSDHGNCYEGSNQQIGLSTGWGDAYRWQRPGNFVEFGGNGDGYYVVRTTVDPLNHVIESRENDNVGYAYVKVSGNTAQLIENGIGTSPWDPHKVINRH